jgi:hypothetical protein
MKLQAKQRLQITAWTELTQAQKTTLITRCKAKFPKDPVSDIEAWISAAEQYDQPLTVEEYADYREHAE